MKKILLLILFGSFCSNVIAYEYKFTTVKDCKIDNEDKRHSSCKSADKNITKFWIKTDKQIAIDDKLAEMKKKSPQPEVKKVVTSCDKIGFWMFKRNIAKKAKELYNVSDKTIDEFLNTVQCSDKIKYLRENQPEIQLTLEKYLYFLFSKQNMSFLKDKIKTISKDLSMFNDVESIFNVEKSIMFALWMHETKFSAIQGSHLAVNGLANNAFDRKSELFERNLIQFLYLVDLGHFDINTKASWAGAIGMVQFMPQTFLKYAINYTGAEKIDLINSTPDAMASLSNYLINIGWEKNAGLATEVVLPKNFDYCSVGLDDSRTKTVQEWIDLGIKIAPSGFGAKYLQNRNVKAWIIIPDRQKNSQEGCNNKAFLVYENFARILDWNRSMFFAIGIAIYKQEIEKMLHSQSEKNVKSVEK